jgi:hypothetical protein
MAWLRKKPDPLSDRARALNHEIAQLESEIKRIGAQLVRGRVHPSPRSAAPRPGDTPSRAPAGAAAHEPIFEEVDQRRLEAPPESALPPDHYNELGVRKYDLPALIRRVRGWFQGPATTNPKLVSYLAAGGIQGLRPLRYEKRKKRRQVIILAGLLFLFLLGTLLALWKH